MKILNPSEQPMLGRLSGFNRKHRLRSKHYAAIEDFPESPSFDLLERARLSEVDFFTNEDQFFVASAALCAVMESLRDITKHAVEIDGNTVFIVEPVTDDDVMYASNGFPPYSKSGYNVLKADSLRGEEEPGDIFTHIRNAGLWAISDKLVEAANAAGICWELHDIITDYEPFRSHPYSILDTGYAHASVDSFHGKWATLDQVPPHPLAEIARDEDYDDDPNESWRDLINDTDDHEDVAIARYSSGLPLPELHGKTEETSKSRRKKLWREAKKAGIADFKVPNLSTELIDELANRGVKLETSRAVLRETTLEEEKEFWVIYPPTVQWIDWRKSDVGFRWSGMVEGYFDLHPTEASYSETQPIVRIEGTTLVLIHESIAELFSDEIGFYLTPLFHRFVSRNLDDYIRVG